MPQSAKSYKKVFLSLGSNLGDRGQNLQRALVALEQWGAHVLRMSSLYETDPVEVLDQPAFLNMAVEIETDLAPFDLLMALQRIEQTLGRNRHKEVRYGPRTLDLDILLFGSMIFEVEGLTIPHPRFHQRKCALEPLAEIASDLIHPALQKSIRQLLDECQKKDFSSVQKLS